MKEGRPQALSDRLLLSNRHQLGVHLAVSGHLRSAHSQTTQPAQTHPIRTGGLRRRLAYCHTDNEIEAMTDADLLAVRREGFGEEDD